MEQPNLGEGGALLHEVGGALGVGGALLHLLHPALLLLLRDALILLLRPALLLLPTKKTNNKRTSYQRSASLFSNAAPQDANRIF